MKEPAMKLGTALEFPDSKIPADTQDPTELVGFCPLLHVISDHPLPPTACSFQSEQVNNLRNPHSPQTSHTSPSLLKGHPSSVFPYLSSLYLFYNLSNVTSSTKTSFFFPRALRNSVFYETTQVMYIHIIKHYCYNLCMLL